MTKEFFGKQMDRLRNVYSATSLSPERIEILWANFKGTPEGVFEAALNHLIGEYTTQALPAVSRFHEAVARFREQRAQSAEDRGPKYNCEGCSDRGHGFVGDTVIKCTCALGANVSAEEIARHQASYDRGRIFLRKGFIQNLGKPLPYNPNIRGEIPGYEEPA